MISLQIKKIITENSRVKTFVFDYDMEFEPGAFVMCWIPGFDELPFGLVSRKAGEFMITVAAAGDGTKGLHSMKENDYLGFRGPFGSSFKLPESGAVAIVAGGYGIAALYNLVRKAKEKSLETHVFLGARTKVELLYLNWLRELDVNLHLSTDDGTEGYKGFNVDLFGKFIEKRFLSGDTNLKIFTVGPEIMEVKVAQICWEKNIPFEISLERFMKCGFGICGQCCVDKTGWRMCVEGPVVDGMRLKQITEFGKYHRMASGKVEEFSWGKK